MKTKERGITLIALVVTIIVLLILAGVSIQMLIGQSGILKQAQQAREETAKSQIKDDIQREILEKIGEKDGEDLTSEEMYEILDNYFEEVPLPEKDVWNTDNFPDSFPELKSKEGNYLFKLGDIYRGKIYSSQKINEKNNTLNVTIEVDEENTTGDKIPLRITNVAKEEQQISEGLTYTYYLDETPVMTSSSENTYTYTNLKESNSYTLKVHTEDGKGNFGESEITVLSFSVDGTYYRCTNRYDLD